MNKKVLYGYIAFAVLIVLVAVFLKSNKQASSSIASPAPTSSSLNKSVLMGSNNQPLYSSGSCAKDTDCVPAGCSSHMCSSDAGLITTCEAISNHPKDQNYSCGCVSNKCVWNK